MKRFGLVVVIFTTLLTLSAALTMIGCDDKDNTLYCYNQNMSQCFELLDHNY